MVINKYSLGILFVFITLGGMCLNINIVNETNSSFNHGTSFDQWRPDSKALSAAGCDSCHNDLTTSVGSGALNLTTVSTINASTSFTLQAQTTGFTQAKSDIIVIGFNSLDANNSLFSVKGQTNNVDYWSSISVDASGNSQPENFTLTAPSTAGTYHLLAYAVHAKTTAAFYYIPKQITIQVTASSTNVSLPTADIITYKINQAILIDDGQIDPAWSNVQATPISEFGSNGYIKSVQDGTYLYTLLVYDSSYSWIAVEFNVSQSNPNYMEAGTDGWVFGTGQNVNFYGDYQYVGQSTPVRDTSDLVFFSNVTQNGLTYIETARLLVQPDNDSQDIQFHVGNTYTAVFASSADHEVSHKVMTWAITDVAPTGGVIPPQAKIQPGITMQQISDFVFVISVVIVLVTVVIHISLRVVSKPITHEKRIVYSSGIPNHPGSINLMKTFLKGQKNKIFKPKAKTEPKTKTEQKK